MNNSQAYLFLCIFSFFIKAYTQTFGLKVLTQPHSCFGGETCRIQPVVAVIYRSNNQIARSFVGSVYAQVGSSPTGFEQLYIGESCGLSGCSTKVTGTMAKIPFINGVGSFENLYFVKAGANYSMKFTGLDTNNHPFALVFSNQLTVSVGQPFKLALKTFIGTAYGGEMFSSNPTVTICDRGGNQVVGYNNGSVTASLIITPENIYGASLKPKSGCTVSIINGLATFQDLYINEAGYPYQIQFSASNDAFPDLISRKFDVAVGKAVSLGYLSNHTKLSAVTIYAGEYIANPPTFTLLDKGGNFVLSDNSTGVKLSIQANPTNASIGPHDRTFVVANQGIVRFHGIKIDKPGLNYTLRFDIFNYSASTSQFYNTGNYFVSEQFVVHLGVPRKLELTRPAETAWAGNQPFGTQPILTLTDYAGNRIVDDSISVATISLVQSLSVQSEIVIDTTNAPLSSFASMAIFSTYENAGAGQIIDIAVEAQHHLWVNVTNGNLSSVFLQLGVFTKNNNKAQAVLLAPVHGSRTLWFRYIVGEGDVLPVGAKFVDVHALKVCGTCSIYDGNFNAVDLSLPIHAIEGNITIDTNPPKIIRLYTNTSSGNYGAGQAIELIVEVDQPVQVKGRPLLFLSLQNNDTVSLINGTERAHFAYQSHNSTQLHFVYHVVPNDNTYLGGNLTLLYPFILVPNVTWNETIITLDGNDSYVYSYEQMSVVDSWIKRLSSFPTTHMNYSIPQDILKEFNEDYSIQISTRPPRIDVAFGIQTNTSPGRYYPGEKISFFLKFDQPIMLYGVGIILLLDVYDGSFPNIPLVPSGKAFVAGLLPDNQTVQFDYIVENYCSIVHVGLVSGGNSLRIISNDSYVRQKSTNPIQPCDLSTSGLMHLTDSSGNITLYGFPPVVTSVTLAKVELNAFPLRVHKSLYPDDVIYVAINFSEPVTFSCPPVFILQLGFEREAVYFSGNNSRHVLFRYTIAFGDEAIGTVGYNAVPNALCTTSGCSQNAISNCKVCALSSEPTMVADLRLPYLKQHKAKSTDKVVPLGNYSVYPLYHVRNSSVVEITCRQSEGVYGVGSVFYFDVLFSDVVVVQTSSHMELPAIWLTTNTSATYFSGNYGKLITFSYVMTENDTLLDTSLGPKSFNDAGILFPCAALRRCSIVNEAGVEVDYSLNQANISSIKGIFLDPTPPYISNIIVLPQNYTAGQAITIQIVPNFPVIVGGVSPRIKLKLTNSEAFAVYNSSSSSPSKLNFDYLFQLGDTAANVSFADNKIDLFDGYSQILRQSTIPTTPMNVSFPHSLTYRVATSKLHVDTIDIPVVTQVQCLNSSGIYRAGDKLFFQVEFSLEVVVCGRLLLGINMGNAISYASYIGYHPLNASRHLEFLEVANFLVPSSHTRVLVFQYTIKEGDMSLNLEYADTTSLLLGNTDNHDVSYIKRFIATDAIVADLTLPLPGGNNSISADGMVRYVDGRVPYLQEMKFSTPSGVYSINESIYLFLKFSAPVVVVDGIPSILLETGRLKNEAMYVNGSGTDYLWFQYDPEPGDQSDDLDYYSSRSEFGYSDAFQYNGAKVLLASTAPCIPAHIVLNPTKGFIQGESNIQAVEGIFLFADSSIYARGLEYEIIYEVSVPYLSVLLSSSQIIPVSFSSEWELRPQKAWKEEMIGYAVDIQDDIAVIGAPNFNSSVTTIQVVTIDVEKGLPRREIQAITTTIVPRPAVQKFFTTANVNQTIGGYFTISLGQHGTSRLLPASIDASSLVSFLDFDLEGIGRMNASVEPYYDCLCHNAYMFTVTFEDITTGELGPMVVDDSMLTGNGARVSDVIIVQTPSLLQGTFNLSAFNRTSNPVPFDANVSEITRAIESLGLSVYSVAITMESSSLTRTWSIELNEYNHSYEIPLLGSDGTGLYGGDSPNVFVTITQPGRHGPDGIAGHFRLAWRGNTTVPLSPFISAVDLKAALEDLPIINTVNVTRTLANPDVNAYSWTIEFVSVNYHNSRGYFPEIKQSNLEPIIPINHLIATGANIAVAAKWELGSRNEIYNAARQGTFGEGAGAVFVYQRKNESWLEVSTLRGNDTVEANRFGSSISIDNGAILVGATGANVDGVAEKQEIFCMASSGDFRLAFRGWMTDSISYNVSLEEFTAAIISSSDIFQNLYSIRSIQISGWQNPGGLCNNNSAIITFFSPVYGAPNVDGSDNGANLELLTIYSSNLTSKFSDPIFNISERQRGTWKLQGSGSDPQQRGAAYVFRYQNNCDVYNRTFCMKKDWKQEAQFFPTGYIPETRFGERVVLSDNVALIGATEYGVEVGALYIFEYDESTKVWSFLQRLDDPAPVSGNHFGRGFAKFGNTLAVGSPNSFDDTGNVYIYTRRKAFSSFTVAQLLTPIDVPQGSTYGTSISMYQNWVVIGAPDFDSKSIYFGRNAPVQKRTNAGAVYVFHRNSINTNYVYMQMLNPSNIRDYDNFGSNVKIDNGVILVSAIGNFDEALLLPSKVVMQIQTQAAYGHKPVGGFFRILWKFTNVSSLNPSIAYESRLIRYDVSALQLKYILQEDLHTGDVIVSRSRVDEYDGGYAWQVTFMSQRNYVDIFEVDTRFLTGTNATVNVTYVAKNPPRLRSKVHLFELQSTSNQFVEELFLSPHVHQHVDRCGWAIGLSGSYAIVGCPNRDRDIPLQNSGAAFIFDLILLNLKYTSNTQSNQVVEGSKSTVLISFDESSPLAWWKRDVHFYLQTLDRNSNSSMQYFVADIYGLNEAQLQQPTTFLDDIQIVGNATARSQFYGSDQMFSRWVDGRYDYRAISDYVRNKTQLVLLSEGDTVEMTFDTNPDSLVELPFETVNSIVHIPGLWPSFLSKFYFTTTIEDNMSGYNLDRSYYSKFIDSNAFIGEQRGQSVVVSESFESLFVGAPFASYNSVSQVGRVLQYGINNGSWAEKAILQSPTEPYGTTGGKFGTAVAFDHSTKRKLAILAISEPDFAKVYVFIAVGDNYDVKRFVYDTALVVEEATLPIHYYGGENAVGVFGQIVVIGAAGLETVYVFRHVFNESSKLYYWSTADIIRSSDYDYDLIDNIVYPHRQYFGRSVSISGRSIVVGAPYGDYANSGSNLTETYDTEGMNIFSVGKGRSYVFYSQPASSTVCLTSAEPLREGTFVLDYHHYGIVSSSVPIRFNGSETDMLGALSALENTDNISVTKTSDYIVNGRGDFSYCWTIVWNSEWSDVGELSARWYDHNCSTCSSFDYPKANRTANISAQVETTLLHSMRQISEVATLNAPDGRQGNRFGFSVAIDGDYIVVGAPFSAGDVSTTWDFEVGDLIGWSKTGDAFDHQPTYGDNSMFRLSSQAPSYLVKEYNNFRGTSSNMKGRYYISTYDRHPGDSGDFSIADSRYPSGSIQGNAPTGTLTSDVFLVLGTRISFYIGGGCDINSVYVELITDGKSVGKHTGQCSDAMNYVEFNVASLHNRAVSIRIVDNSTISFIAVDHFEFDWDIDGARKLITKNKAIITLGKVETLYSGAAFLYKRTNIGGRGLPCLETAQENCTWRFQGKLSPSDKRENSLFGSYVAINGKMGIAAVGAPKAELTGTFKDTYTTYPYMRADGSSLAGGLRFPVNSIYQQLFQGFPKSSLESSASFGVNTLMNEEGIFSDLLFSKAAGAVYFYRKQFPRWSYNKELGTNESWSSIEVAKLQSIDSRAEDYFGHSISVDGHSIAVGATGVDVCGINSGAAYYFSTQFMAVRFSQNVFYGVEGSQGFFVITLLRDLNIYDGDLLLEYATSDITAKGIDKTHYEFCMNHTASERSKLSCGDYEQTVGVVSFPAGVSSSGFTINIIDDNCYEADVKFIQLSLSIPGGSPLQGEGFEAMIRIDDDDFSRDPSVYCN